MDVKFRSLIEELSDYAPRQNRDLIIESRAQQIVASATNLMQLIRETYEKDIAEDLTKRLVRAIASGDGDKFGRKIKAIREARKK